MPRPQKPVWLSNPPDPANPTVEVLPRTPETQKDQEQTFANLARLAKKLSSQMLKAAKDPETPLLTKMNLLRVALPYVLKMQPVTADLRRIGGGEGEKESFDGLAETLKRMPTPQKSQLARILWRDARLDDSNRWREEHGFQGKVNESAVMRAKALEARNGKAVDHAGDAVPEVPEDPSGEPAVAPVGGGEAVAEEV